jgi:hypothetical protein
MASRGATLSRERSPNPEYSNEPAAYDDDDLTPQFYDAYDEAPIRSRRRGFTAAAAKVVGLALVVTIGIFGYHLWTSRVTSLSEVVTADARRANDEATFLDHLGREVVTRGVDSATSVLADSYMVRVTLQLNKAEQALHRRELQSVARESPTTVTRVDQSVTTVTRGDHSVKVASQIREAEAQVFRALQARYLSILGKPAREIHHVDLGDKGVFYVAEVGPFATAEEAGEMCKSLKAAGGQCLVWPEAGSSYPAPGRGAPR